MLRGRMLDEVRLELLDQLPPKATCLTGIAFERQNTEMEKCFATPAEIVGPRQHVSRRHAAGVERQQRSRPGLSGATVGNRYQIARRPAEPAQARQKIEAPIRVMGRPRVRTFEFRHGDGILRKAQSDTGSRRRTFARQELKLGTPVCIGFRKAATGEQGNRPPAQRIGIARPPRQRGIERLNGLFVLAQHRKRFSFESQDLGITALAIESYGVIGKSTPWLPLRQVGVTKSDEGKGMIADVP